MDIKEIQSLIKFVAKSGASEVKIETGDIKITIKTGTSKTETTILQATPLPTTTPIIYPPTTKESETVSPENTTEDTSKYTTIKSPIIGTFYRKSTPDKPNFVEVGTEVIVGDPVCVIEAMKLFNEIESEVSGKIVKVLVEDTSPVEFDQPLFLIDPS